MSKKMAIGCVGAVILIIAIITTVICKFGGNGVTNSDFLSAQGKELKNDKGETVYLKGINIGNYFVQEFWMGPCEYTNVTCQKELEEKLEERFGQ